MKQLKVSLFIYAALAATALAQDKPVVDSPELVARREEYLRSVQRASAPLLNAYVRDLETLKGQYTRQEKLDAAVATERELKLAKEQLAVATAVADGSTVHLQLTIMAVQFGDPKTNRLLNVTRLVQKAFVSGAPTIQLSGKNLSPDQDPAAGVVKSVIVSYTVNGQRKEKTFEDGRTINFRDDLP